MHNAIIYKLCSLQKKLSFLIWELVSKHQHCLSIIMLLHEYAPGDKQIIDFYGHGFGSIFGRLLSKVAAKTASKAALGVAKRAGSTLMRSGMRKVVPIAKKSLAVAVKKGVRKATPVARKMIRAGVKRAAESAQSVITDKVRKIENAAIKKGVPTEIAQMVSSAVENGSRKSLGKNLSKLVGKKTLPGGASSTVKNLLRKVSTTPTRPLKRGQKAVAAPTTITAGKRSSGLKKKKKLKRGKKNLRAISYRIQNLIDSA